MSDKAASVAALVEENREIVVRVCIAGVEREALFIAYLRPVNLSVPLPHAQHTLPRSHA